MHIHSADRNNAAFTAGCGRHSGSDATFTLRRRALLEVAASAAAQAPPTPAVAGKPACSTATVSAPRVPDSSTYDVSAMRREKGSVSILTQDGDAVRIRFRSTTGVAVQADSTSTADATISTTSVYAFASGRMQVEVTGELDADELKAIGDLMEKVDSLASQFFDGDTQAAFSSAAELGFDAGEIAGFALRLSVKESVRATLHAPALPDVPAAMPASPAPAQATESAAPAPTAAAIPTDPTPAPAATAESSVEPADASASVTADAVPTAPTVTTSSTGTADPAATLQRTLGGFLSQVLEALSSAGGTGRAEFSMKWKLQVMIAAVQSAPAASTSDAAGTRLGTDSLQSVASAQA